MGSERVGPQDAMLPPPPGMKEGDGTMSFGKYRDGVSRGVVPQCRTGARYTNWRLILSVRASPSRLGVLVGYWNGRRQGPFREGCATGSHPVSLGYQPWTSSKWPRLQWGV